MVLGLKGFIWIKQSQQVGRLNWQRAGISHFLTIATKFSCCSSTKKCVLCFLSLALTLCHSFSRRALLACHPLSLFLCLSLALYSKFADMTINVSLIPQATRIQKKSMLSSFVFIDSLVVYKCWLQMKRQLYFKQQQTFSQH